MPSQRHIYLVWLLLLLLPLHSCRNGVNAESMLESSTIFQSDTTVILFPISTSSSDLLRTSYQIPSSTLLSTLLPDTQTPALSQVIPTPTTTAVVSQSDLQLFLSSSPLTTATITTTTLLSLSVTQAQPQSTPLPISSMLTSYLLSITTSTIQPSLQTTTTEIAEGALPSPSATSTSSSVFSTTMTTGGISSAPVTQAQPQSTPLPISSMPVSLQTTTEIVGAVLPSPSATSTSPSMFSTTMTTGGISSAPVTQAQPQSTPLPISSMPTSYLPSITTSTIQPSLQTTTTEIAEGVLPSSSATSTSPSMFSTTMTTGGISSAPVTQAQPQSTPLPISSMPTSYLPSITTSTIQPSLQTTTTEIAEGALPSPSVTSIFPFMFSSTMITGGISSAPVTRAQPQSTTLPISSMPVSLQTTTEIVGAVLPSPSATSISPSSTMATGGISSAPVTRAQSQSTPTLYSQMPTLNAPSITSSRSTIQPSLQTTATEIAEGALPSPSATSTSPSMFSSTMTTGGISSAPVTQAQPQSTPLPISSMPTSYPPSITTSTIQPSLQTAEGALPSPSVTSTSPSVFSSTMITGGISSAPVTQAQPQSTPLPISSMPTSYLPSITTSTTQLPIQTTATEIAMVSSSPPSPISPSNTIGQSGLQQSSSSSELELPTSTVHLFTTSSQARQATSSSQATTTGLQGLVTSSEHPTATPSPTNGIDTAATTGPSSSPSTIIVATSTGGTVIFILLVIILLLCCCYVCSKIKKKRRRKYQLQSFTNPQATNRRGPVLSKYSRRQSNGSVACEFQLSSLEEVPHNELYHERAIETNYLGYGGTSQLQQHSQGQQQSQVQQSQMSTMTELFQAQSLPKLSPISYSSQLHLNPYRHMEPERGPIGTDLDISFPNGSPSLRVPTRMALSLQNEETKSGSKISLPGSRSSHQGSKASILGSRTSVQGSRSQIFNTGQSREDIAQIRASFLLGEYRESQEDDNLSFQLSRTASPLLDESQVPTRDSPNVPPLATSHPLGHGKKDFASLTCIPNHPAMEEELTMQEASWQNESFKAENPPSGYLPTPKRKSFGTSLGELTTLDKHDEIPEFSSDREEKLTVTESSPEPSEQKVEEEETGQKKPSPAIKKPRSRAMSKLEKLTSLEYIRASLRLKKKKVSFQKTPESTPKSKKKKKKKNQESEIFRNKAALEEAVEGAALTPPQSPSTEYPQTKKYPSNPSRYPPTGDFFNPDDEFELQGGPYHHPLPPHGRRQRGYTTDVPSPQAYAQLSQPYYPQMTAYQPAPTTYAQLSQPYYRPPLEAYYPQQYPPGPPNPYSRRYSHEAMMQPSRYPGMVGPNGYPTVTSPDHERYRSATTPDRFMEPGSRPDVGYLRAQSPDRFTDTSSNVSDRYRARSPDRFTESTYMSDRYNMDSFMAGRYTPERYPHDMIMRMQERCVDPHQYPGAGSPPRFTEVRTPDTLVGSFDDGYRGGSGRPDGFLDSMEHGRHYSPRAQPLDWVVDGFEHQREKNTRRFSDASISDKSAPSTSSKSRVSWDSEIIEYPRPPSDMSESDIDLNL